MEARPHTKRRGTTTIAMPMLMAHFQKVRHCYSYSNGALSESVPLLCQVSVIFRLGLIPYKMEARPHIKWRHDPIQNGSKIFYKMEARSHTKRRHNFI